ncbi:MAG TPA: DUF2167 domain-containing protein [Gemmatimonadaceae bacterium]|nr:DUF2167 domain-containing protein [Gemmatimonadaceae bacterium]
MSIHVSQMLRHQRSVVTALVYAALAIAAPATAAAQADSSAQESLFASIEWTKGPVSARLGSQAELRVPEHCRFTGEKGAKAFLIATQNPPDGSEKGVLICEPADTAESPWFVVFSYDGSGYVRDNDRDSLDADKILATIRSGTDEANKERRKHGWGTLTIDGWIRSPYYDSATHNLTWSTRAHDDDSVAVVNHSVRLLGRGGVLHADLVLDPSQLDEAVPSFDGIIASTSFLPGHTYGEWRKGDKVAKYGLTALVAGGAGVAAAKLGLFGKLFKVIAAAAAALWKALVAAVVGIGAWFKRMRERRAAARRRAAPPPPSPSSPPAGSG